MTGIFISYSRKDSQTAHRLMEAFTSIDLDVWVDWEDIPPAVGWLDQILQGIEAADAFLFLVSPDSAASEVCAIELEHARKNAKRIIPIVVRDVDPKTTRPVIRDLNWIFMRESDDFAAGLEKIKVAINLDLEWLQEHRRLQVRALDWDRRKDPSLLLRGGDLRNAARLIAKNEGGDPAPSELQKHYLRFSGANERVRIVTAISAALAVLVMALLSWAALDQRQDALANAAEAERQRAIAEENEDAATVNARAALAAKAAAEKNAVIASAQRSAARAQIYQTRAGGLFTSSLLAIDSYQRNPSLEAGEILRENVSLLPAPVKQAKLNGAVLALAVAPDGETFIVGGEGGDACLIRFESGESLYCLTSSGSVLDAAFSPDGKTLAVSSSSGQVQFFDAASGSALKELDFGVAVFAVNFNPDGRLIALARDDGRITLVKSNTYEFAGEFSMYGSLRVTAFSPDGEWFAAGSDTGSVTFWNLSDGQIVSGAAHGDEVRDLAFSPDSRALLSGGADTYAVMTSPDSGDEVLSVQAEDWVEDVEFSPDGSWFATASNDFRIRIWDSETGEELMRLLQDSIVSEIKISPNGLWIASTGSDRTVRVWSAAEGAEMFQIPLDDVGKALGFSGDSASLVTGDSRGNVSIWDISALETKTGYLRFDDYVWNIESAPNGGWIAASTSAQVWLLDPRLFLTPEASLGKPILDLDEDEDIFDLTIAPDGKTLAVSTGDGRVIVVDTATKRMRTLVGGGPDQYLAFHPDGKSLILADRSGLVQTRSLGAGNDGILWQAEAPIYSIAISPAHNLLAVGLDERVVVLDLTSGNVLHELSATGAQTLLAFDPAGELLASSSSSGQTFIWKREAGGFELLASPKEEPSSSMSFSPNGNLLFLGGTDVILILDSLTGDELNRIRLKGDVEDLAFSPEGGSLFSASLRVVQRFDVAAVRDLSGDDIVAAACSRLTRNFTPAEWSSFFGEEEYRLLCPSLP